MAITLVGTVQVGTTGNGNDVTLTFDGSPAEGDYVVVFGGVGAVATRTIGPTTAGYTQIVSMDKSASNSSLAGAWYKKLGATPDTTVVCDGGGVTTDGVGYISFVLRGVDPNTFNDATPVEATAVQSSTSTPDPEAITTVTDGAWVFPVIFAGSNFPTLNSAPTGYSNGSYAGITDTERYSVAVSSKEVATAGAEDPGTYSMSQATDYWTFTIAVRPEVGSTVSLYAIADGTLTNLVDEADLTTGLFDSIDDDPASPTDTDWVNNADSLASSGFFDLTNMPADFATADTAEIVVRYRGQNYGTGTVTLYAQLFQSDESTSLSNEVQVAQVTGDGAFANTSAVTITGLNTTANKTVWDGARVRLRWATT